MNISAKVDYALRALLTLSVSDCPLTTDALAEEQDLPAQFLGSLMADLRRADFVISARGAGGGFRLARPPQEITLAEVVLEIHGPLARIRGLHPEETHYEGAAEHLQDVWIALQASQRSVLESLTLADVASGNLPSRILTLIKNSDAWAAH